MPALHTSRCMRCRQKGVPAAETGRYYSFDWGNVHFISLDTNDSFTKAMNGTGEMLRWLETDLQQTRQFWKVVYFHHPPYVTGFHEGDLQVTQVRERIVPILERHNVQLLFNGHEHSYQRSRPIRNGAVVENGTGVQYIVTGGGGAGLFRPGPSPLLAVSGSIYHYVKASVEGSRITLSAIQVDTSQREGREFDRIPLGPPSTASITGVVNAASFTQSLAPGELISIYGRGLATVERQSLNAPLPTRISETSVMLNGQRLPLLYVSPTQINSQLPFDAQGPVTLTVMSTSGSAETTLSLSESAPAIFGDSNAPAIVHSDGTLV